MARRARRPAPRPTWDAAAAIGEVIPTPIMHWLLERGGPIGRFSQSMLLRVPADLAEPELATALQALLDTSRRVAAAARRTHKDWGLRIAPRGTVAAAAAWRG